MTQAGAQAAGPEGPPTADDEIEREELAAIQARRGAWVPQAPPGWRTTGEAQPIGLALSGGGIRSATFSLGVLRELSALGLLHRFDYLSTVSGGTYVGAFLCGLFVPRGGSARAVLPDPDAGDDQLDGTSARRAIDLLRQSGRYLAPTGMVDYWFALAILVRNWLALHAVIGSMVFAAALAGVWVRGAWGWSGWRLPQVAGASSPLALLPPVLLAAFMVLAWAYWLTRRDVASPTGDGRSAVAASGALVLACLAAWIAFGSLPALAVALVGSLALVAWARSVRRVGDGLLGRAPAPAPDLEAAWDDERRRLTRDQSTLLLGAVLGGAFALADEVAFRLASPAYQSLTMGGLSLPLLVPPAAMAVVVPLARTLLMRTEATWRLARGPLRQLAARGALALAAALLAALILVFWWVLAYRLVWSFDGAAGLDAARAAAALGFALILAWGVWSTAAFLNLSSLATFYAGRLRRAYLGAGNPGRLDVAIGVEKGEGGDDVALGAYFAAPGRGAPLHLVNITLNQTRGRGSSIVQRDRRGRNMTVGPGGVAVSGASGGGRTFIPYHAPGGREWLPLSAWIGISGAAFSTGLGSRTGFGPTTLAGLANVRLGYWWRGGRDGDPDPSVQRYLLDELLGRFAGTDLARWYLSDGGHFENTAVYELVRRRLPFILACDNGQDEAYAWEDVANLVRKARIDFGAEVAFLGAEELDALLGPGTRARRAFGTLAQIGGAAPAAPGAVAALARIAYRAAPGEAEAPPPGTLVLVKPRLTGDGPADLVRYQAENRAFPHQSTLDQFFDEAQWESYYALGRHVLRLVMEPRDARWTPRALRPLPR